MDFSSVNPYQTLAAIEADSPKDLVARLHAITTPIKIVSIVSIGSKQVAYVMGDVRTSKKTANKKGE